jgi:hypothetical protein
MMQITLCRTLTRALPLRDVALGSRAWHCLPTTWHACPALLAAAGTLLPDVWVHWRQQLPAPLPCRQSKAEVASEAQRQARLEPLLARLQETLGSCKQLVGQYSEDSSSSTGPLGLVRAMFRSGDYQQRFLDINGDLSTCLTDLQLALNVQGAASQGWLQ